MDKLKCVPISKMKPIKETNDKPISSGIGPFGFDTEEVLLMFNKQIELMNMIDEVRKLSDELKPKLDEILDIREKIDILKSEKDCEFRFKIKGRKNIKKLVEELNDIKGKVEKNVMVALGQMFNGTLVDGKVSVRNGTVYVYRCQYKLSLTSVLRQIKENKDEVKKKLKKEYFEILEKVLEFYDSDVVKLKDDRRWRDSIKEIEVNPEYYIKSRYSGVGIDTFERYVIRDDGWVEVPGVDSIIEKGIIFRNKKEIEKVVAEMVKDLTEEVADRKNNLEEIRKITAKLVMFAELKGTMEN